MASSDSSSLGVALGLGHAFYVGFDKHTARVLMLLIGVPLFVVVAAAIAVLSHADVGWSIGRLEVWWASRGVSDQLYAQHRRLAMVVLRMLCILPPALSLLLGVAATVFMGSDFGLAGLTLLPALTLGGWAASRARHIRWQLTPRVRIGGCSALVLLLGGQLAIALSPTADYLIRATVLLALSMMPLSAASLLLASGPLLGLSQVIEALGGANVSIDERESGKRQPPTPMAPLPPLGVCAVTYAMIVATFVAAGCLGAVSELESRSVVAVGIAIVIFDGLALTYAHSHASACHLIIVRQPMLLPMLPPRPPPTRGSWLLDTAHLNAQVPEKPSAVGACELCGACRLAAHLSDLARLGALCGWRDAHFPMPRPRSCPSACSLFLSDAYTARTAASSPVRSCRCCCQAYCRCDCQRGPS